MDRKARLTAVFLILPAFFYSRKNNIYDSGLEKTFEEDFLTDEQETN